MKKPPPTQADAILHPIRLRILSTLYGRRLPPSQIALALPEVAQATLYRHINRLAAAGVLTVVEQRPVRGTVEKVYAVAEAAGGLTVGDAARMSCEDWENAFRAFTTSLLGQFGVYLRQAHADPTADGVGFRTAPLYLTDAELARLAADLNAVVLPALAHGPGSGRRRRLLSTILIPDPTEPDPTENGDT